MAAARIFDVKRGVLSTTNNGTATLDIAVPTGQSIAFLSSINLKETTTNTGGFIYQTGSISNNGGSVALNGSIIPVGISLVTALAAATAVYTANSTNLRLTVTGVALIGNVDWLYEIKLIYN